MFQPSVNKDDITPRKEPETNEVLDSTLMRDVKKDIGRMEKSDHDLRLTINTNAMHLSNIVREMDIYVERLDACRSTTHPNEINMLGWHKYKNYLRTFEDEEFVLEDYQQNQSDLMIHKFLINNVKEKINYNVDQLSSRTSYRYI